MFHPTLSLRTTAPEYSRTISKLTLPDGSEAFVPQSFVSTSARLAIAKTIRSTGGEIFIDSELERLDLLEGSKATSYLARPIGIGLRQSLFAYNPYKWQERVEPLRYEESSRQYIEDLEAIAITTTNAFFDHWIATDQLTRAKSNFETTDTLLQVLQQRHQARRVSEEELLQAELRFLNARLDLQQSELDVRASSYALQSQLAWRSPEGIEPEVSFDVPPIEVAEEFAISQARQHRAEAIGFERRVLESKRDVAEARGNTGPNLNLYATYGLSQTTPDLGSILDHGEEYQQVSLAMDLPILDWGRRSSRKRVVESNRSVTEQTVTQQRADFDHNVAMNVKQFMVQRERILLAAKADEIAEKRFEATKRRSIQGRGDMTSFTLASTERDAARRRHVEALRGYWVAFHELRRATHFDFAKNEVIGIPHLDW